MWVNVICYFHLWLAVGPCACRAFWFVWQPAPKRLHLQHGFKSQQAATADKAHPNAQGREWDRNSNTLTKKIGITYGRSLSLPGSLHIELEEKKYRKMSN